MRETTKQTIRGIEFELYSEPTYGDENYVTQEKVKFNADFDGKKAKFGGVTMTDPDLLKLERAIKGWSLSEPVSRQAIQNLPLNIAKELLAYLGTTEWGNLGE